MFTYAAGPEPSGLFVAATAVAGAIVLMVLVAAWRRLLRGGEKRRNSRVAVAAVLSVALLLPVGASAALVTGRGAFTDRAQVLAEPTQAQRDAEAASLALNKRIVEEGAVLLKNDGALPLDPGETKRVNVFGMGSVQSQFTTSLRGADPRLNPRIVTLPRALEQAGLQPNPDLVRFYESQLPPVEDSMLYPLPGDKGEIAEVDPSLYADLIDASPGFSSTAIFVVTRQGGEGGDLHLDMGQAGGDPGKHYLQLQDVELDLLRRLTDRFQDVIVIVNAANQMELGFIEQPGISAALWVGEPGDNGFEGVAALLAGEVSPSGRLVDTFAYDATSAPSYKNFGDFRYLNEKGKDAIPGLGEARTFASYVDYEEGIYVGYRYYETRWADEAGTVDEEAYRAAVQFPFGYGLSYTQFDQQIAGFDVGDLAPDGQIRVSVRVTNSGAIPGREVVQLYSIPPYYAGGIEKSRVELAGFAKTRELQPGESETVDVMVPVAGLAAYDHLNHGAWVLEAGDYAIALQSDAHALIEKRTFHVPATLVFADEGGEVQDAATEFVGPRGSDEAAAENRFGDLDGNEMIHLSRADWEGTEPVERRERKVASQQLLDAIASTDADFLARQEDFQVVPGDVALADLTGLPADDPLWERYMEQFTPEQLVGLVGLGGWVTDPIPSQGVPRSHSVDGPVGVIDYVTGVAGVGFASTVVLASTFDVELVEQFGEVLGAEAAALGYQGLYAPGMNLHRSPFGGRNFEYYSEDPFLSGALGAATVRGYSRAGVYAHIKHFAVNEQETNRAGVATWLNEQALRELYLRPFQMAVQQGEAQALMGSYNRLGTRWTGAVRELNVDVLRGEWGFDGHLVTDFFDPYYMNPDQAVAGGIDLIESTGGDYPGEATLSDPDGLVALRTSARHILYTFANSGVAEVHEPDVTSEDWVALAGIALAVITFGTALLYVTRPRRYLPVT